MIPEPFGGWDVRAGMRARSLLAGAVFLVATISAGAAGAQTKAKDPCGFVTRRVAAQCLGTLLVGATSGDDFITLDDHRVAKGSVVLRNVTAGKHVVVVDTGAGGEVRQEIQLSPGGVAVVKAPGARLAGPSALPIAQATAGVFDECDGTYLPTRGGSSFPLSPADLVELRKKPGLATHLPTPASYLARPETACRAGDGAACLEAARAWERSVGTRGSDAAKAQSFFDRGCDLGNVEACVALGMSLAGGLAGAPNEPRARTALEKACNGNSGEGCRRLGDLLAFPHAPPTPQSAAAGLPFMKRGCELGDHQGCVFARMLQLQVSCDRGDPEACELGGLAPKP